MSYPIGGNGFWLVLMSRTAPGSAEISLTAPQTFARSCFITSSPPLKIRLSHGIRQWSEGFHTLRTQLERAINDEHQVIYEKLQGSRIG